MIPIHILCDVVATRDALAQLIAPRFGAPAGVWSSAGAFLKAAESLGTAAVLIDLDAEGSDAVLGLLRAIEDDPRFAAVVVTGSADIPTAVDVMRAGAENLIEAPWTEEVLADSLDAACFRIVRGGAMRAARERIGKLSPRERDVLDGLLAGRPNKTTARVLGISPRTIESYRASLMTKLDVGSLAEALRLALAAGMLPDSESDGEAEDLPGQLAA